MVNSYNKGNDSTTKLREYLTIITLILSISGVLYSIWFKPAANISILSSKMSVLEYRITNMSDDIKWIKNRIK